MAQVLQITRPKERLISAQEVAARTGLGYESALALVKRIGVNPSGKPRGRWYCTEIALHRALLNRGG